MVVIVVTSYNCTPFLHSLLTKGKGKDIPHLEVFFMPPRLCPPVGSRGLKGWGLGSFNASCFEAMQALQVWQRSAPLHYSL